jgi:glycosyltransferase involved in cell wall biosynthesis
MIVGVFLGDAKPELGGTFTFERELLDALVQWGGETSHTFMVFSQEQERESLARNVRFVSLRHSFVKRLLYRLWQSGVGIIRAIRYPSIVFGKGSSYERLILQSGVDVLWCPTQAYLTMEIPCILTVLDLQHRLQPCFPEVSTNGQWDVREATFSTSLRRASVVITGTETGKAEIERFYQVPAERIKVLPLPTPQFALNALPVSSKDGLVGYSIPDNYLFYPAQFWPHKNHANLLQAVRLLRDEWKIVFPVVFAGSDKGNRQYIQKLVAELDLSSQVHFLGFVPEKDLIALYQHAFALTFPTFFGPDNLPPLESFALGCPVIASNVPGAQEQLGDAALLVDPKSPKQIALAVKSLYDDPGLREALMRRGRERAVRWAGRDYVQGVFSILDEFEVIRRCWD